MRNKLGAHSASTRRGTRRIPPSPIIVSEKNRPLCPNLAHEHFLKTLQRMSRQQEMNHHVVMTKSRSWRPSIFSWTFSWPWLYFSQHAGCTTACGLVKVSNRTHILLDIFKHSWNNVFALNFLIHVDQCYLLCQPWRYGGEMLRDICRFGKFQGNPFAAHFDNLYIQPSEYHPISFGSMFEQHTCYGFPWWCGLRVGVDHHRGWHLE